jgi:HK97 gp10 family phage protein
MAYAKLDMTGMEAILAALENKDKQITAEAKAALEAGGKIVLDKAKEYAAAGGQHPQVDTGALLGALKLKTTANARRAECKVGVIGAQSASKRDANGYGPGDYAWMVENGHGIHNSQGRAAPHPFLEPAFTETENEALETIADKLREVMGL